ncbi:MAG: carbohydrate ABC transporter permease, partial [Bdellovibrionales bacterium]|nr:carbohydrate ABC transporter permease [Bdellovibrionales bacterium]
MKKYWGRVEFFTLLILIILFSLFPFYWAVVSSLKRSVDLFNIDMWPPVLTFINYHQILKDQSFLHSIWNSTIVAGVSVLISLLLALLSGFSLSRLKFSQRNTLLGAILAVSMFPQIAVLSGMFELIRFMGLYNSLSGLIFSYMILIIPFTTWTMK